jgi:hypothetical protein
VAGRAGRRSAAGHAANVGTNTSGAGGLYPIEAWGLIVLHQDRNYGIIPVFWLSSAEANLCAASSRGTQKYRKTGEGCLQALRATTTSLMGVLKGCAADPRI